MLYVMSTGVIDSTHVAVLFGSFYSFRMRSIIKNQMNQFQRLDSGQWAIADFPIHEWRGEYIFAYSIQVAFGRPGVLVWVPHLLDSIGYDYEL